MTGSIITQDVSKCEIKDGNEKKRILIQALHILSIT